MISAQVENLAWINAGFSGGEHVTFPTTFEKAQALLERLDLADGKHDLVITEYETDIPGLAKRLSQYDNLDELNYLASLVEDLDEAERIKFIAAIEHGEYVGEVPQLINLAQNLECYDFYQDIHKWEDLGHIRAEGKISLPGDFRFYFDYEALGRDSSINEGGEFTEAGYIYSNRSQFVEHYNGKDIPQEYRLFSRLEQEIDTSGQLGPMYEKEVEVIATETKTIPIVDSEDVQELLSILRENNAPSTKDFLAVLSQVGRVEKQLENAVTELAAMRRELKEAQEQNHPVKTVLQKAVIVMQGQVLELRDKLTELKQNVIDGCKNAVAAFKEKGISALDKITRFFKVRPLLENMRDYLEKNIQKNNQLIEKIESISTEYHKAGRHLKNMGRAMLGKEAVQEAKPSGKVAKAIAAPFRTQNSNFMASKRDIQVAIHIMQRLEERAAEKPSIKKTIEKHKEQVAGAQKSPPDPARSRPPSNER